MLNRADTKARTLADLPPVTSDSLLALIALANADPRPHKIDVGVGVFRDGEGNTPILKVMKENSAYAARLVARLARDFPAEREPCPAGSDRALDFAIVTPAEFRDPALVKKLDAVAGRVL